MERASAAIVGLKKTHETMGHCLMVARRVGDSCADGWFAQTGDGDAS